MTRVQAFKLQLRRVTGPATELVAKYPGEFAVSVAGLVGWFLVTASIATLLPHAGARATWLASTGLLLVSLSGWKLLRRIATDGLYILTRKPNA